MVDELSYYLSFFIRTYQYLVLFICTCTRYLVAVVSSSGYHTSTVQVQVPGTLGYVPATSQKSTTELSTRGLSP